MNEWRWMFYDFGAGRGNRSTPSKPTTMSIIAEHIIATLLIIILGPGVAMLN